MKDREVYGIYKILRRNRKVTLEVVGGLSDYTGVAGQAPLLQQYLKEISEFTAFSAVNF